MKFRSNLQINRTCQLDYFNKCLDKPIEMKITNTQSTPSGHNFVCGLNNLGNTCFFNSVLQNLAQTPFLLDLLDTNLKSIDSKYLIKHNDDYDSELTDHEDEPSLDKKVTNLSLSDDESDKDRQVYHRSIRVKDLDVTLKEPPGVLSRHLFEIIQKMNQSNTCQNPGSLFSSVCKKVPSFKGFQQQDSHELLRNLLDAVKSEELKRRQAGILEFFKINKSNGLDEVTKKKIKRYGRLASHTLIDRLFGGHLLSTIVCDECKTCLQRVEPFLDLSLPIVDDTQKKTNGFLDELNGHFAKGRFKKLSKEVEDTETLDDPKSKKLSKHQMKKLKREARRAKKRGKTNSVSKEDEEEEEPHEQEKVEVEVEPEAEEEQVVEEDQSEDDLEYKKSDNYFRLQAMDSVSVRTNPEPCSLESCLSKFTSKELLSDKINCENCSKKHKEKKFYTHAMKQYLVCNLPAVLTIHLKRFQQHGFRYEKSNKYVSFPLVLDMSPYTSRMCLNKNETKILYSLYGLVEHSGKLNSGHYTAYVKPGIRELKSVHFPNRIENEEKFLINQRLCHLNKVLKEWKTGQTSPNVSTETRQEEEEGSNDKWYYISDSHVSEVSVSKVLKTQAYLLFYERIQ